MYVGWIRSGFRRWESVVWHDDPDITRAALDEHRTLAALNGLPEPDSARVVLPAGIHPVDGPVPFARD